MWNELKSLWRADDVLGEAWDMSYEAINIDAEMFNDAVDALWGDNSHNLHQLIFKKDKLVNKYEREIRRKVITHLAVQGQSSLAPGLVLSTVVVDIERIGDYVKNIVELAEVHPRELDCGEFKIVLNNMEEKIRVMFKFLPSTLEEGKESQALEMYHNTREIGKTCDQNIHLLLQHPEKLVDCRTATTLVLYFRYLKRINAHLRNIISSVINPYDRIGYSPRNKG